MRISRRLFAEGGSGADGRGQQDLAVGGDVGGFDHRPVEWAERAVAQRRGDVRQVHVEEPHIARVDRGAQRRIRLPGRAKCDSVSTRENAVERGAGRNGVHTQSELAAGGVLGDGALGQRSSESLGNAGGGESAESDVVSMADQTGRFRCAQTREMRIHVSSTSKDTVRLR